MNHSLDTILRGPKLQKSNEIDVFSPILLQSDWKGMVKELIYEAKYQISAGPGGP